jgi:SAM-dependent methyltransferase
MLDYSEHALALASDRFRSKSIPGRFVRGDIENLSLADGRFDIVYSGGVLEFFSDVERPVAEMARVLRTGGLFTAGMVPLKFSIQTIADFERTVAYSARNVLRGRFRDAFVLTKMVDVAEGVKPWTLSDYLHACDCAGLVDVTGRVTNPFPQLALPRVLNRRYARLMKVLTPGWRRFDESVARWTDVWGLGYTIHGRKAPQHRASR